MSKHGALVAILVSAFVLPSLTMSASPPLSASSATLAVYGGTAPNGVFEVLLFTWDTDLTVSGNGWAPGEVVTISLHGPLGLAGVSPSDVPFGTVTAGATGSLSGTLRIPYDGGQVGPTVRILRPGGYVVNGTGGVSGTVSAAEAINLGPATSTVAGSIDWGVERGGRDGVLPGPLHVVSPERIDPEWATVWSEDLVELYGTVAATVPEGAGAQVSYTDHPARHYAHDWNFFVLPDRAYRWTAGTKNFFEFGSRAVEVEWEVQNNGSTHGYGLGNIGLPAWAAPTTGDRVFVVGRWILDTGHPDGGSHTEIHPPKLLATMRDGSAVTSTQPTRAARVDVYVSGHGGGANRVQLGISTGLSQSGYGGGRIQDAVFPAYLNTYYRAGPYPHSEVIDALVFVLTGKKTTGPIYGEAGPSAFPIGGTAPEERPVNDRDYDFDVRLPRPPQLATAPRLEVVTRPEHTTAVKEVITYGNVRNGLPTTAHVHLPYLGADSGIYARTLLFAWDTYSPPGMLFHVRIDGVHVIDTSGDWHLWSDVSGDWMNLTSLAPAPFSSTTDGQDIGLSGAEFDVRLSSRDTLRVYTQGYRAECLDGLFGRLFDLDAYSAMLKIFQDCGAADNTNLGGALLELPADPAIQGHYTATSPHFTVEVTVGYVPE
jgi:hypothetical protein